MITKRRKENQPVSLVIDALLRWQQVAGMQRHVVFDTHPIGMHKCLNIAITPTSAGKSKA